MRRFVSVGCGLMLWLLGFATLLAQEPAPKAFGVRPKTPQFFEAVQESAPQGNAGLFVGVNEFTDPAVAPLQFAVHDAIEQAWLFVSELKLIPPANCTLALSGEPKAESVKQHLAELKRLGVKVVGADKVNLLDELVRVCRAAPEREPSPDLLIVSFSSHGFEDRGTPYLMPHQGRRDFLEDTALKLLTVEERMHTSHAGHHLLLVDACQERVLTGEKKTVGAPEAVAMSKVFYQALQQESGQAKLSSCSAGEFSYEHATLGGVGHGVFTYAFLEALRGGATADDQNLIRLGNVAEYVTGYVQDWVTAENINLPADRRRPPQTPGYHGPIPTRQLPLAVRASDLATLQATLKRRISPAGFTQDIHDRLLKRLESYDPASGPDRELLASTRDFAEGKLKERFYLLYLEQELDRTLPNVFVGTKAGEVRGIGNVKFCWCPPGSFQMGSPTSEVDRDGDETQVSVRLTRGFWMGQYEVTQAEWEALMGENPSYFNREKLEADTSKHPVEQVSWEEASEFCQKLTAKGHREGWLPKEWKFDLPTEAQWEYACRAGTTTATAFGDKLDSTQANFNGDYPYNGAAKGAYKGQTVAVGSYEANAWNLHDMHGNVWEWCRDWYVDKLPGGTDPEAVQTASVRVLRGGSWFNFGRFCRCANRSYFTPGLRHDYLGFRPVAVQSDSIR